MISKHAADHPFNRGDYTVGAPTTHRRLRDLPVGEGSASLQGDVVPVLSELRRRLEVVANTVQAERDDVVASTRDWWAGTVIGETAGNPATPDAVVVHVSSRQQVQEVLRLCSDARVPVTVSAGRSNVTGAALPVHGGVVLDVCGLNRITDVDPISQVVNVQAGMFGDVFEQQLQREHGLTTGHWPSSYALSTIGGWVACRGAGQLSTRYGKIEDMVTGVDVILADGQHVTLGDRPRSATGPDLLQMIVGSEGTLGVITDVRVRTHRLPEYARAHAVGFDSFEAGLEACREILQQGATPSVLRLYDALESRVHFDEADTNVLLIADEGHRELVDAVMSVATRACHDARATVLDGEAAFARWLDERFVVGKHAEGFTPGPGFVSDTLEMAASWSVLPEVYRRVTKAVGSVAGTLAVSAHQSHAYVDGACLYFSLRGDVDVDERYTWYRQVWDAANAELVALGATISHHHGVGLLRGPYMAGELGDAFAILQQVKKAVDPHGILNPGKLGLPSPFGQSPWR